MTLQVEEAPKSAAAQDSAPEVPGEPVGFEAWGWSSSPDHCFPKVAALASLAHLEPPQGVARVSYTSHGNVLVVAGASPERARGAAQSLAESLHVTLLEAGEPAGAARFAAWSGRVAAIGGYLGEFAVTLQDLRTAPGAAATPSREARFDLVLDFSREPLFAQRHPPQGYFRAPADEGSLPGVLDQIRDAVGDFEKPRFFAYRENLCAHQRSEIVGCNACVDICSTAAISPDGDHVKVDPHLCMGCGACATVCPSGAMSFQFPRVGERGAQVKQLLATYRHSGGRDAVILFHDGGAGRELLARAAAAGQGLPARALPLETWHVAAIGLDLLLPAIAFGASQVVVLASASEDREYVGALREQMAFAQATVSGLGYAGRHFAVIEPADAAGLGGALAEIAPAQAPATPATFLLSNDKRTAIEFAVEHLAKHAPLRVDEIALPAGAPFGEIRVDARKCTMCMACVGACPESALMDGVDQPLLKFVERNCVQCGLCESTCPEEAIDLNPRLLLTPQVRETRVLNETQPFHCVSCGKAFGTKQMVESMLGRLAGHSMFSQGGALRRLQMCGDCRVVDMMSAKDEVSVLKLKDVR
jgi:ferredoxin